MATREYVMVIGVEESLLSDDSIESAASLVNDAFQALMDAREAHEDPEEPMGFLTARPLSEILSC